MPLWRHLLWILTIALYAFLIPRALAQVQHSQAGVTHITLTAELNGTLNGVERSSSDLSLIVQRNLKGG